MTVVCFFFQENAPENISAEEKRLLDRLVTVGRRKGLHLSPDTQEVTNTETLQSSHPFFPSWDGKTSKGLKRIQIILEFPLIIPSLVGLCFQEIKRISKLISELSIEFNRNLNEDTTFLVFSERELGKRPRPAWPVATDTPSHVDHFLQREWPTAT